MVGSEQTLSNLRIQSSRGRENRSRRRRPPAQESRRRPAPRQRILIVDDSPAELEALRDLLTRHGLHVVAARSVADAVGILDAQPIDLVITDLRLPREADGLSLIRHIHENFRHTAVVVLTGHASGETGFEAGKLGAAKYLVKPLNGQVVETLHEVLKTQAARRGPAGVVLLVLAGGRPVVLRVLHGELVL